KTTAERRWCLRAVRLPIHLVVYGKILLHNVPGLLRDHEQTNAQLRHDRHRLRRHRRGVGAPPKRFEWIGPDVPAWLLQRGTALDVALFEAVQDELSVFHKTLPPFVLVKAKAFILNAGKTAAQSQNHPPTGQMIE